MLWETFFSNQSKNDICYLYFEIFFSNKIFCLKIVRKMTFAISILKFFFQKKFFALNCPICEDKGFFFDLPKLFSFSSWPPINK